MARTYSTMPELGRQIPDLSLRIANPNLDEIQADFRTLEHYQDRPLLVLAFTCNHCPYAIAVEDRLIQLSRSYHAEGVQFLAICSNDADQYPEDSFDEMARRSGEKGYPFPYLHDEDQSLARACGAACTPDFFVYDKYRKLRYRGRMDDGRPGQRPSTSELKDALDQLIAGHEVSVEQIPSMGCNIKWKQHQGV